MLCLALLEMVAFCWARQLDRCRHLVTLAGHRHCYEVAAAAATTTAVVVELGGGFCWPH